jgi:hypothetical protein
MYVERESMDRPGIRAKLSGVSKFFRHEWPWLIIASALSIAIHAKYRLTGFGEQDAARLARDAIIWHLKSEILSSETSYRMHTSPGYIQLLKIVLDHGMRISHLPKLMNWLSVVLGTACAAALYALFRQVSAPRYCALAVSMYSMTPGFWLGNVYGMPTIPALCGFALSVLLFIRATRLQRLRGAKLPLLIAGSWACLCWSLSFKADLVLCTGIFVIAALSARGRRWRMFALASLIVLGSVFATTRYAHHVLTLSPDERPSTPNFLKAWSAQFPFKLGALLDSNNNQTIVHCACGLLFSVLVIAILGALAAGGRQRRLALAALVWAVPPILFWGLLYGNNARHSVFGMAPLFLVAAEFVFRVVYERTARAFMFALCLVALSYWSETKGRGPVAPASNLLESAEHLEQLTQGYHRNSRRLAASPSLKRAVIDSDIVSPYLDFEVFALAQHPVMRGGAELDDGPQVTIFAHSTNHRKEGELERSYRRQGYDILAE